MKNKIHFSNSNSKLLFKFREQSHLEIICRDGNHKEFSGKLCLKFFLKKMPTLIWCYLISQTANEEAVVMTHFQLGFFDYENRSSTITRGEGDVISIWYQ